MIENLTEGLKRNIYYELATHDVIKKEERDRFTGFFDGWSYTFGRYRLNYNIHNSDEYINMYEYKRDRDAFVIMTGVDWDEDYPKNTVYEIYVAAENKATGKPYIDPYKKTKKNTIQDSKKRFTQEMQAIAGNFLPYDTPKDLREKIIEEMETILTSNLRLYYRVKNR